MEEANLSLGTSESIENESFWKSHLELQKGSGLTRKEYCRTHEINYARFGYWFHKWKYTDKPFIAVKLREEPATTPVHCTLDLSKEYVLKIHTIEALSYILARVK